MTFNGIRKDFLVTLRGKRRPPWAPLERNLIPVIGMAGAHVGGTTIQPLPLEIPVLLESRDLEELKVLREELAEWLVTDEPKELIFDDEPNRIYYAMLDGSTDIDVMTRVGVGMLNFICPDPFRYSSHENNIFIQDSDNVYNLGSAEADPIFTLDVIQPITYAMISNGEEYMMIGNPSPVEKVPYVRQDLIMHDTCDTTDGWAVANYVDNGVVTGNMISKNGGFTNETVGTPVEPLNWQGPSIKRSIGESLQDFRIDIKVSLTNSNGETGMIEVYLLDVSNNVVVKIGIEDIWRGSKKVQGKFQLGTLENRHQYYKQADYAPAWNDFNGVLKIFRSGNRIRPYFALIEPNGRYNWVSSSYLYVDEKAEYLTPITQVQVATRMYPATKVSKMSIKDIKVWRYNEEPVDGGVPYIAEPGDRITFDHKTGDALINGEPVSFDFGSEFFKLQKGPNSIIVSPEQSFETSVRFRERYR